MSQEIPSWVPNVDKYRNSVSRIALRTFNGGFTAPFRGQWVAGVLEDFIAAGNRNKVNYLEVGVGGFSGVVACPYEPYYIAGAFEHHNIDYSGLIVDRSRNVLDNLVGRTRVFHSDLLADLYGLDAEMMGEGWKAYVAATRQQSTTIKTDHPQLKVNDFDCFPMSRVLLKKLALLRGIKTAKVSPIFASKIETGQVSVLQEDITRVNLAPHGPFDVGVCMNVLYYLNRDGQKIAVNNMVSNIISGGIVIYNDSGKLPLLEEHGGWLDFKKQQELGLSVSKVESHDRSGGHSVVLSKR